MSDDDLKICKAMRKHIAPNGEVLPAITRSATEWETCPSCRGSGKGAFVILCLIRVSCQRCHGAGRIPKENHDFHL